MFKSSAPSGKAANGLWASVLFAPAKNGILDGDWFRHCACRVTRLGRIRAVRSRKGCAMSDVKSIEEAVRALPPGGLAEFRQWFAEFDAQAWDHQITADLGAGKLDALLAEAQADFEAGSHRKL